LFFMCQVHEYYLRESIYLLLLTLFFPASKKFFKSELGIAKSDQFEEIYNQYVRTQMQLSFPE
jgi:hypothetical protein